MKINTKKLDNTRISLIKKRWRAKEEVSSAWVQWKFGVNYPKACELIEKARNNFYIEKDV